MRARWIPLASAVVAVTLLAAAPAVADHGDDGAGHGTVAFATTCSTAAQPRFERAVAQLHSFGFEFARAGFEAVAAEDPACGMAWWGIAATWYHPLWAAPTPAELAAGRAAAERAAALGAGSEREKAWIAAIGTFYADSEHADHATRAGRYRDALAAIAARDPDDHEARIFEALLLLGTAPLRDTTYAQQKKAVEILTPLVAEHPEHPGIAHYLIHSLDYPSLANLALDAARRYARIAPSSAHALHMPSHIFVRLGLWPESIASNLDSAGSARAARSLYPETASFDQLHALDYLAYAYLQTGQDAEAKAVAARAAALFAIAARKDGRGLFVELFHADGFETHHVFVDLQAPLEFVHGGGRAIEVQKRIVTLAVLADTVGQIAQAPVFGLADLAAQFRDRLGDVFDESIDLLRRDFRPRDKHVFVERHFFPS